MNCNLTKVILLILIGFAFSCQMPPTEEATDVTTEQEAAARTEKVLEIYNEGNLALIDELYAPDFVSHSPPNEDEVGLDVLKESITSFREAFPDINMTFDDIFSEGDKTATRWTFTGTHTGTLRMPDGELPPTGKNVRISGVTITRIADGKTAEQWVFMNALDWMNQLGFTVTPPTPPPPGTL
jgi:steroid delta-isomerase-like uncharacterized protein